MPAGSAESTIREKRDMYRLFIQSASRLFQSISDASVVSKEKKTLKLTAPPVELVELMHYAIFTPIVLL